MALCVVWGDGGRSSGKLGKLVITALSSYKDAKKELRTHERIDYNKNNVIESQKFVDIIEGKRINIEIALSGAKQRGKI